MPTKIPQIKKKTHKKRKAKKIRIRERGEALLRVTKRRTGGVSRDASRYTATVLGRRPQGVTSCDLVSLLRFSGRRALQILTEMQHEGLMAKTDEWRQTPDIGRPPRVWRTIEKE